MEVIIPDELCVTRVNGDNLQIADKMARGDAAVPLTPEIKPINPILPLEPIAANGEHCVRKIKLVCLPATVKIHLMPIARRKAVERATKARRHRYLSSIFLSNLVAELSEFRDQLLSGSGVMAGGG